MNKKKIFILTSVVIIVIALGCCGAFWAFKTNAVITNDAVIEPEQIAINATDNGRIKEIFVKPDEEVESGQLVAEIEIKKKSNGKIQYLTEVLKEIPTNTIL